MKEKMSKKIEKCYVGDDNLILDVIITQEKIDGKIYFVAQGVQIDVASQGLTLEEALGNIKDAAEIVLENSQGMKQEIISEEAHMPAPMLTRIFL